MYAPCLGTNIISVITAAVLLRQILTFSYPSQMAYIIVAVLFIVGQFLYFTHRFKPLAGTISIAILILALLLLRLGLGTSPFLLNPANILTVLIILQIIKLPIG